jgi:hypothetical protein
MKHLIYLTFCFFLNTQSYSQGFINTYEKYRLDKAENISNSKTRNKIQSYIRSDIVELDTIFQAYKIKTKFDFNNADSIFLIYDSPVESPFTSDVIVWSSKDTISYKQGFKMVKPNKYKRIISYEPFLSRKEVLNGFKVITERDSLVSLVSKRDFNTINHLGDNQNILDGSYYHVVVAYKLEEQYKIESCSPSPFVIKTTYKKE